MLDLYIDVDAHAVYPQILRIAQRHSLELYVVTNDYLHGDPTVHLIAAEDDQANGSAWITGNITRGDICITGDSGLAVNCLVLGALALSPTGRPWVGGGIEREAKGAESWPLDARAFALCLEQIIASMRVAGQRGFTAPQNLSGARLGEAHQRAPLPRFAFA
jgi:uncharacterized protein YaiI (UPF0178 family)